MALQPAIPFDHLRSIVRVRPWIEDENKTIPDTQAIPRPSLEYKPGFPIRTLIALDPALRFKPKRNGEYEVDQVLWSWVDEFKTPPSSPSATTTPVSMQLPAVIGCTPTRAKSINSFALASQADVYAVVGAPMVASVMASYNAMLIVNGPNLSGKHYSLFGDEYWSGEPRGIVPRFCFHLLEQLQRNQLDSIRISLDVECVAVVNEAFVDLLAQKGRTSYAADESITVRDDAVDGVCLKGVIRQQVPDPVELEPIIKAAVHRRAKMPKNQRGHLIITIRLFETHMFADPSNATQTVSKQRRVNIQFVMLQGQHLGVTRCFDAAVQRDSGSMPQAVVPVRESNLTRLLADAFGGNTNVTVLTCISPFFQHHKDQVMYLQFAARLRGIRCQPRLNQDSTMTELRKLNDELKNLAKENEKVNEAIVIVQQELNRREEELRSQLQSEKEYHATCEDARENRERAEATQAVTTVRFKRLQESQRGEAAELEKKIGVTEKACALAVTEGTELRERLEKTKQGCSTVNEAYSSGQARLDALTARYDELNSFEEKVHEAERIVAGSAEAKKNAQQAHEDRMAQLMLDLTKAQQEHDDAEAASKTAKKEKEPLAAQVAEWEALQKEVASLEVEIAALKNQKPAVEKECKALQEDIARLKREEEERKRAACCVVS